MAILCDANELASAAACFNQGYGPIILKAMRIRLLCAFLNQETMDCSPEALAPLIGCFSSLDQGTLDAIETYLVCQVANAGGGGGGSPCLDFSTSPPVAPPDPAKCASAIVVGYGAWIGYFWVWDDGFTNAWVQVPGGP